MKLPKENSIWLGLAGALVIGVVVLVAFAVSGLTDLPDKPPPPRDAPPVQTVGTTPQEQAAALTAGATADATQVARYNADVTAWATERSNRRTASFALLAGAVALLTAAVGAAAHAETVRKNRGDSLSGAAARADVRFATAIEHLSNSDPGVRIGGIYTFEALAREDPDRIQTLVQVLLAHVAPWAEGFKVREHEPKPPFPAPNDLRTAFAVVARVRTGDAVPTIDLRYADLEGADLAEADLCHADLRKAVLTKADLRFALLGEANLQGATLAEANLDDASLAGAKLAGANLSRASLRGAHLSGANFEDTVFQGVHLSDVNLRGVNLTGANLTGANLHSVDLSLARLAGPELIGASGVGSHASHERHFPSLIGEQIGVISGTGDDAIGVVEQTQMTGGAGDLFELDLALGVRLTGRAELLWISNPQAWRLPAK